MKRFAKVLLVTVGFGALGFVMSLVPQKNATGAAGAPVNIISSVPLTVQGTVGAQQSGTWNVGITGTPTVNANVTFPSSLLIHHLDDPGRIPFQSVADMSSKCNSDVCTFTFGAIPQGRRLVLQHVSGTLVFSGNATSANASVFASQGVPPLAI